MKRKRDGQLRKKYAEHYGPIPLGREIHHLLPWYAGGTDEWSNLVALTPEEHMQAHFARWKETGDFRELCSYYMIGHNFTEAHRISSSEGGKIGGQIVKRTAVGICVDDPKKRSEWASMGGKVGGKVQKEQGLGIHGASAEQNREWASLGGKKGAFVQSDWQKEFGRRGGPKNKGFVWVNDKERSYKYTAKMQIEKPLEVYLNENPHLFKGRVVQSCVRVWVNDGSRNFMSILVDGQSVDEYLAENPSMRLGRMQYV
jgi:hypothetical protein